MNRKLIFTDLDGTLLDSDKKISNETEKIIKALVSQGHYFCFVTGRSMHDALPFYKQLGLDTICICNNGAAIHNPADEHFSDIFFPINKDVFFKLYQCNDLLDQLEYFIIKTRHHTFTNKIPTERKLIENFKI
jgi:HAD superfamily hydrolase (TIGR01484 family)